VVGSFRFLPCDLIWLHRFLNDIFWNLLISFGYELVAIPCGNASIVCGVSCHVWDLPSVIRQKILVTICHRLHQRRAILANRDIQRNIFPPIYHGLWHCHIKKIIGSLSLSILFSPNSNSFPLNSNIADTQWLKIPFCTPTKTDARKGMFSMYQGNLQICLSFSPGAPKIIV
jgi:hypothetical protein